MKLITAVIIAMSSTIAFALPIGSIGVDEYGRLTGDIFRHSAEEFIEQIKMAGLLQKVVKILIQEGEICAVHGHIWELGCGYIGCAVIHTSEMRYCAICGKTETMEPGEWK